MFACEHEGVEPDIICLAKGITGGYLPLAATLTTQEIVDGFLGGVTEHKTFYHGHTYTGNALGSAAALGEEYYQQDSVRNESVEMALSIERALRRVWGGHPVYVFVPAHADFERKYQTCVDQLMGLLNQVP